MSAWVIAGATRDAKPIVGRKYEVRHSRKGTFVGRVVSVNDDFAEVEILDGVAAAIMQDNVRYVGERVSIRDTLSYLIEIGGES